MKTEATFEEWLLKVPVQIRSDPLWNAAYYRQAMYLYDLAWQDCEILFRDLRGREVARQLIRSAGSISANIEEAYGRGIESADAIRMLRIALAESRESRGWYLRARSLFPAELLNKRMNILSDLIGTLVSIISNRRRSASK